VVVDLTAQRRRNRTSLMIGDGLADCTAVISCTCPTTTTTPTPKGWMEERGEPTSEQAQKILDFLKDKVGRGPQVVGMPSLVWMSSELCPDPCTVLSVVFAFKKRAPLQVRLLSLNNVGFAPLR
jgi:hypothetical protein